jgi:hydroxyethylthiazole kinase
MRHHRRLRDSIDRPALLWHDIERIRAAAPLVHSITNFVVMNTTANALLALGASPVMAHAAEEVADLAAAAALVVNIGTLSPPWVESMSLAMRSAARAGRPIVFDPVGAGATAYRTASCCRLLEETPPSIIRGNASEVRALAGASSATKGVDSADASETALEPARFLAGRYACVVVVSGAVDIVVSANRVARLSNGHAMMPRVTGLGCTATALIGAFAAVNSSLPDAAAHAMAVMGIAGELAAAGSPGPGTFQVKFLDALYCLTQADVRARLKMQIA